MRPSCHRPRRILLLLALLAGCGGEPPAPSQAVALESLADTVLTPYSDIGAAASLGGTRWVLVAPQDQAVTVADFASGKVEPFAGRERRGLLQPYHLFTSGDSVFVADWQQRRLTVWSRAGALVGTVPAADVLRGALPRARDSRGRWYFELRPAPGLDGSGNRDSAAVVRTSADLATRDTIARLAPPELVEVLSDGRRRLERRLLSGQDRWGILPDGALWVARLAQNRVDRRDSAGQMQRGVELPDPVLPVTDSDRDIFLNKFEPSLRATVAQTPFAVVKPPFEDALTGPARRVWLIKNRALGDSVRNYQAVGSDGRLALEISHPGLGRILALSDSLALVAEPFEQGVRLLLFRIPGPAR